MVTVAGHDLHLELPMRIALLAAASALTLAACSTTPSSSSPSPSAAPDVPTTSTARQAVAVLASASGSLVSGSVTLTPMGKGLHLTGEIGGLQANSAHAFHIHEKGDCSAADASSAGPHFNPFNAAHGKAGSGAHHAGDMNNLTANAEGVAKVDTHIEGVTLGGAFFGESMFSRERDASKVALVHLVGRLRKGVPVHVRDLVAALMDADPARRPSATAAADMLSRYAREVLPVPVPAMRDSAMLRRVREKMWKDVQEMLLDEPVLSEA